MTAVAQVAGAGSVLVVRDLVAGYGRSRVIDGISMEVGAGAGVGIVGPNGAGKSTLLRALSGLVPGVTGEVWLNGVNLLGASPDTIARAGLLHVPEGRRVFDGMTVRENLRIGAIAAQRRKSRDGEQLDAVLALFPRLEERLGQEAQTLSGGEQQMLAIGRALMGRPEVLLVDEPAMGLAPVMVKRLAEHLRTIRVAWGVAVLVAEQSAAHIEGIVSGHQILADGRLKDTSSEESPNTSLLDAYRASSGDGPAARSGRALTDGNHE